MEKSLGNDDFIERRDKFDIIDCTLFFGFGIVDLYDIWQNVTFATMDDMYYVDTRPTGTLPFFTSHLRLDLTSL